MKTIVRIVFVVSLLFAISICVFFSSHIVTDKLCEAVPHYYDIPNYCVGEIFHLYFITGIRNDAYMQSITFPDWPEADVRVEHEFFKNYGKYLLRTVTVSVYTDLICTKKIHQAQLAFSDGETRLVDIGEIVLSNIESDILRRSSQKDSYQVFASYSSNIDCTLVANGNRLTIGDELEIKLMDESNRIFWDYPVICETPTIIKGHFSIPSKYQMCVFNLQQTLFFKTEAAEEKIAWLPAFEVTPDFTEKNIEAWYIE